MNTISGPTAISTTTKNSATCRSDYPCGSAQGPLSSVVGRARIVADVKVAVNRADRAWTSILPIAPARWQRAGGHASGVRQESAAGVAAGIPINLGFVTSLNRPGGNITGASFLTAAIAGKRLELLRELLPTGTVIDYLVNPDNALGQPEIADAQTAARAHGLKLQVVNVVNAHGEYDFDQALTTVAQHRPDALFVGGDPLFLFRRRELVPLVARHAIPAIYNQREYVVSGGLMSYGTSISDAARQAGVYIGRILKGEKPADLPVTQSTRFELVINLNTAKTPGLKVPLTLQVAADEVIE